MSKKRTPIEYMNLDLRTVSKIVSNALANATVKTGSTKLKLERTIKNRLSYISRTSIISALELIAKSGDQLFLILPSNYPRNVIIRKPVDFFDDGESKLILVTERTPITLMPLARFENWRQAHLQKQALKLADLTDETRDILYKTISAINNEFQFNGNPTVTIRSIPDSDTENSESRRNALAFLFDHDVVFKYDPTEHTGTIKVHIEVREFLKFRDEIFRYYSAKTKKVKESEIKPRTSMVSNHFAALTGLIWEDITINFIDGHKVKISARGTTISSSYEQMGFEDKKKHEPNQQWALLQFLADHDGKLSWRDSAAKVSLKKRKQLLADTLKQFFNIKSDPFYAYRQTQAYSIKIKLISD